MKTKSLVIIFILFLLATLAGVAMFLKIEKNNQPIVNDRSGVVEKQAEPLPDQPDKTEAVAPEQTVQREIIEQPPVVSALAEERMEVEMVINGVKYEAAVKPGDSAYDLMNELKNENKIDFFGKNYSGLGFFVEEINGVKNNPSGENWIYYVNGRPAQVGISSYLIDNNDTIEWKYEKKSF